MLMKTKTISGTLTIYPKYLEINILSRRLYRQIIHSQSGNLRTVERHNGPYLPENAEADEWMLRDECRIGSICRPNADCYGGGL